jgi:hypothetical protein
MSEKLRVATRKGLFTLKRSKKGAGWRVKAVDFLGDPVSIVHTEPGGERVLAALDLGHFGVKLQTSEDRGKTFAETPAPTYPEPPESGPGIDEFRKQPIPWTLMKVWALASGTREQNGRLWCGTIPGGLFCSDDGGASWRFVESLWKARLEKTWFGGGADWPAIHSILVDPRDGKHVIVGVSCGGVWETRDDGASWSQGAQGMRAAFAPPGQEMDPEHQDPHCIVQAPTNPDVLWCQHHNGVFRTTEGCGHWKELEVPPSSFGFAVVVDPEDADTAWFVPGVKDEKRYPVDGALVVSRTRDGGKSFDVLRKGLPQEHAYDLVFRHALDIDERGKCLAFGSTTGNLFVSEDRGDHWECVSSTLPPIYCVRFA